MKNIRKIESYHSRAMLKASEALPLKDKRPTEYQKILKEAFEMEREAALLISPQDDVEPSRSILCHSAASLAFDCEMYLEAERMAYLALSGDPPVAIREKLEQLLESVGVRKHLSLNGLELDKSELQISIHGTMVGTDLADSNEVVTRLDAIQKLVKRTIGRMLNLAIGESSDFMQNYPTFFSIPRAGSYAITLRVGRPKSQQEFEFVDKLDWKNNVLLYPSIINETVECLSLYAKNDTDQLKRKIRDPGYYDVVMQLSKRLCPDGKKVSTVGITTLNSATKREIQVALPKKSVLQSFRELRAIAKVDETSNPFEGRVLVADDVNEHFFRVVNGEGKSSPRVYVSPGTMADIVRPHWGAKVVVDVEKVDGKFQYRDINPID